MKKTMAFGIMLICLTFAGCGMNKDGEFKTFTTDFENLTNEIVAKVEADPTESGVDAGQAVMDGKKADLKTKRAAIKDACGIQVSQEVQKNFEDSMKRSSEKITGVMTKLSPEAIIKYQTLVKDWGDIVGAGQ
jgi:protein involved in sex pheromone biosynthesis